MSIKAYLVFCFCFCFLHLLYSNSKDNPIYKWEKYEIVAPKICNHAYDTTIVVRTQKEFENLSDDVENALSLGRRNVAVEIKKGDYFFNENHIKFDHLNYPKSSIMIKGNGVRIIAKGKKVDLYNKEIIESTFLADDYSPVWLWSSLYSVEDTIEVVDEEKRICRLKIPNKDFYLNEYQYSTTIKITQWYTSANYKIIDYKDGYLYFDASDLLFNGILQKYNVNVDFAYGRTPVRFCIFPYIKKNSIHKIYSCESSRFLYIKNSTLSSFTMEGLSFFGNSPKSDLLELYNCKFELCAIDNCSFNSISSTLANIINTNNFLFSNNYVYGCANKGINVTNDCSNTYILGNLFENNGCSLFQNTCIHCSGNDYLVSDNIFKNFSYSAISLGVWHGTKKNNLSKGVVEYNEIYYDKDYILHHDQHTLMDGGAIYCCTQNDLAIIRYNYIHDYWGMCDNRGVFCDDGTCNTKIYGNVICGFFNSYTIDLRICPNIIRSIPFANTGNYIGMNHTSGPIKFQGLTGDKSNIYQPINKYATDVIIGVDLYEVNKPLPHNRTRKQMIITIKNHIRKNNKRA